MSETNTAYENLVSGIKSKLPLQEVSKLYTAYVVEEMGGNKVHASRQLGIDRRTIQRWNIGKGKK